MDERELVEIIRIVRILRQVMKLHINPDIKFTGILEQHFHDNLILDCPTG